MSNASYIATEVLTISSLFQIELLNPHILLLALVIGHVALA
jgi:hypothetical protein